MSKQTICIDFDGVIHGYSKGWTTAEDVYDEPTPGAKEAIAKLRETFKVVVMSTRFRNNKGLWAASRWLEKHEIHVDDMSHTKVPAVAYIDDRAINFAGDWTSVLRDVAGFQPWTKGRLGVYEVGGVETVVAYNKVDAIEVVKEVCGVDGDDLQYAKDNGVERLDDDKIVEYWEDGSAPEKKWRAPAWVWAKAMGRSMLCSTEF